jgi:hypothetical protein
MRLVLRGRRGFRTANITNVKPVNILRSSGNSMNQRERKYREDRENYTVRSSIICTFQKLIKMAKLRRTRWK